MNNLHYQNCQNIEKFVKEHLATQIKERDIPPLDKTDTFFEGLEIDQEKEKEEWEDGWVT